MQLKSVGTRGKTQHSICGLFQIPRGYLRQELRDPEKDLTC